MRMNQTLSFFIIRSGAVWTNNKCLGQCSITYGPGSYTTTSGFYQHSCNGNIQTANKIGFWCNWDSGDGAVLMIGGGGLSCARADHGIGITEDDLPKLGPYAAGSEGYYDFGNEANGDISSSYSLNMWVK